MGAMMWLRSLKGEHGRACARGGAGGRAVGRAALPGPPGGGGAPGGGGGGASGMAR